MNNIVNLSQLITRLAKVTDSDPNTARRFLRTFFATIEDALAEGETVEIKGIGTFRRCDDPAVGTPGSVGFAPADDFAEEINRPFAVFEAVELADGLTAEDLEPEEDESQPDITEEETFPESLESYESAQEPEAASDEEESPVVEEETDEEHKAPWEIYGKGPFIVEEKEPETTEETITVSSDTSTESQPGTVSEEESSVETADITPVETEDRLDEEDDVEEDDDDNGRRRHLWIWLTAAGLLLAGVIGYIAAVMAVPIPKYGEDSETTEAEQIETVDETESSPKDIVTEEPAQTDIPEQTLTTNPEPNIEETPKPTPAKETKYDTVTAKRYLAIMAREYYGRSIYWVFIYEANADKLSNPNKVAPGTRVIIPDKESLPGATDAERMAIAEKKAAAIQAKYK